jgi:hypothetical protein
MGFSSVFAESSSSSLSSLTLTFFGFGVFLGLAADSSLGVLLVSFSLVFGVLAG